MHHNQPDRKGVSCSNYSQGCQRDCGICTHSGFCTSAGSFCGYAQHLMLAASFIPPRVCPAGYSTHSGLPLLLGLLWELSLTVAALTHPSFGQLLILCWARHFYLFSCPVAPQLLTMPSCTAESYKRISVNHKHWDCLRDRACQEAQAGSLSGLLSVFSGPTLGFRYLHVGCQIQWSFFMSLALE